MAAIKRETNIVDPLSRISDPSPLRQEIDATRPNSREKEKNPDFPQLKITKTIEEVFMTKISIPPIDITVVPLSIAGIQTLARVNAWKHVVAMSDQLLTSKDQSLFVNEGTQFNLVFRLRMNAFFRLKMFDELVQEATAVLTTEEHRINALRDQSDTGYDRPHQGVCNSDKVLALQLLLIEARAMTGRGEEALQQLYALRKWLCDDLSDVEILENDEILWWKWRIQWSIINTLSKQRQWRQTLFELQTTLRDVQWKRSQLESPFQTPLCLMRLLSSEIIILCRLSRALLQVFLISSLRLINLDGGN
jgi:hypothetical protein